MTDRTFLNLIYWYKVYQSMYILLIGMQRLHNDWQQLPDLETVKECKQHSELYKRTTYEQPIVDKPQISY